MKLDHIMFAANDLHAGVKHVQDLSGISAAGGGSHPGGGTRNALLSFGDAQYLEIIAPDPAQTIKGTLGDELRMAERPFIRTWAAATTDFDPVVAAAAAAGYQHQIVAMSRTRPDGIELAWRLLFVTHHPFGLSLPFFIDWQESPHPADDAPAGCGLKKFTVSLPEPDALRTFCDAIGLEVQVETGGAGMQAIIDSPRGEITLS